MWLRRCIDRSTVTRLAVVALWLVVAGCAATGRKPSPSAPRTGATAAATEPREIPAQARTLFEQAAALMAAGDAVEAELRFQEFLLQYPDYPGAYVNLAILRAGNGDDEGAMAAVESALALDADNAQALNQKGMLLRRQGKFLEAEAAYLKAVTASPEYALAHYNLGVLNELYLQRLDVALQHFEKYQELVGSDAQVEKWIADLTRRVAANQRTANVAE